MLLRAALMTTVFVLPQFAQAGDLADAFEKRVYENDKGESLPYRYLPAPVPMKANPNAKFPLVIFLHGAGERGTDNTKPLVHGVKTFAMDEYRKKYPCYVIAPQCPDGKRWVEVDWALDSHTMPEKISDPLRLTMELVDSLLKSSKVDPDRVYITGLSMGGFGTWDAAQRFPEKFAAAAPVCGGADLDQVKRLKNIPLWTFHGLKDTVVKPHRSQKAVEALKAAGGEARLTEYPEVGHNSWVNAYNTPELYEWLFAQRRGKKAE